MRKLLLLMAALAGLLGVTWVLTESGWLTSATDFDKTLARALAQAHSYQLPQARLAQVDGVWRTGQGEIARAEVLTELHQSLERLRVARVIDSVEDRREFFSDGLRFTVNDVEFEWGDLAPSGDSFFLGIVGDPRVYVVDLYDMGSLAAVDDERILLQAKYQRLRDLLLYPEDRWREERLLPLLQFGKFRRWRKGELELSATTLSQAPWGTAIIQAFLSGLQSLRVKGAIQTQKPEKPSRIPSWSFEVDEKTTVTWEFFEHPSIDLIYVWVPHLGKAYPLDIESSDFLQRFPERLIGKSFSMVLGVPGEAAELLEAGQTVTVENSATKAVQRFLQTAQTFEHVTLLSAGDCRQLADTAQFAAVIGGQRFDWRRVAGGWAVLNCAAGLSWTWSLPLDSAMDFARLVAP